MTDHRYDVAIIGAGISGACAAISLARRGAKVLLLEAGNFPRHKVCGEFLSPEIKATFDRLGVLQSIQNAGAHSIQNARIVTQNGRVLETPLPGAALSISRFKLDSILFEAARGAGAGVLPSTRVQNVTRENQSHQNHSQNEGAFSIRAADKHFQVRTVLAASGRHASWLQGDDCENDKAVARPRYVGFKTHFRGGNIEPNWIELHAWRGGYCGVSFVEDGLINACLLARYESLEGRAPRAMWSWLLENLPALRARLEGTEMQMEWLATGNVQFEYALPTRGPIWCCGDAAGFIHPFTGDGMAMAARSGELAGAILGSHLRGDIEEKTAREIYEVAWKREFESRLKWASRLQKLLIDPQLLSPALSLLARAPMLGNFAVRATRG